MPQATPDSPAGAAFAAVDLGASSGRVVLGTVAGEGLTLEEVHRFPNRPVRIPGAGGTLHWDVLGLYRGVLDGLCAAGTRAGRLASVGIDTWAVDFGVLDADGALLGNPVHYRDARTDGMEAEVAAALPAQELYAHTGLQHLPFNTVYQLCAARRSAQWPAARQLLLIPDLLSYWLTGTRGTEVTNASTTQLIDPRTRDWSRPVADALGIDVSLFPPLRHPGDPAGELLPGTVSATERHGPVPVTAVGSHDTASAVVGVPAAGDGFAYIATGTWSLVGMELDTPVLTEESRRANFTNELGVDGTVRYLRNVMGLWLLQECLREWEADGSRQHLPQLLGRAAKVPMLRSVVDAGDPRFLAPGGMVGRIAEACRRTGQPVPRDPAETTRCVLDSLALAHSAAVADAQRLSRREVRTVHIVGGGVHNELLCQLTADACGLPVVAGPAEAAAYGNILVQARAAGALHGDLATLRTVLGQALPLRQYEPAGDQTPWEGAAARVRGSSSTA
ncbi:rhamnulokinase [Streptomyces reniochalinae]|uniref:Rhamnulokinase n=1 Tax=Streptomyces reniochalinae TaxID=2250578 RepID=A0A367E6G7_9ACTN|nr:rhamnulokinase family protein [Streptomyces reniochalinae]RCG13644.1 rhamnulokinase [Streptomyces reniochalinae]